MSFIMFMFHFTIHFVTARRLDLSPRPDQPSATGVRAPPRMRALVLAGAGMVSVKI